MDIFKLKKITKTPLSPGDHFGDVYVLVDKLGQGGMGQCWKAEEYIDEKRHKFLRHVVIKIVLPDVSNAEAEMVRVEEVFNITYKLHHPNICPVHALKRDKNFGHYLVMQYIDARRSTNIARIYAKGATSR